MPDQAQTAPHIVVSGSSTTGMTDMLRDFLVDGLGMLLPGFGFLSALIPAIFLPLMWFVIVADSIAGGAGRLGDIIPKLESIPSPGSFHLEIFLALIGLAFIVGHLLFRQDIKEPDRLSFMKGLMPTLPIRHRVWRWTLRLIGLDARFPISWAADQAPLKHTDRATFLKTRIKKIVQRLVLDIPIEISEDADGILLVKNGIKGATKADGMVRVSKAHKDLSTVPVEYPYHFLYEYLYSKGFYHLCGMIRWHGTDNQDIPARTKHFINLLKMNILRASATSFSTIAKNEAHIRLASSIWYAAHYVSYASLVGFAVALVANGLAMASVAHVVHVEFIVLPLLTLVTSIFVRSAVEKSLHYQRCREIVFVLHMASLLRLKESDVLHGIAGFAAGDADARLDT